jgi:hypothetical protein
MRSFAEKLCVLLLIIVLTGACAVIRPPEKKRVPYPVGPIVPGTPSDEDLFLLGTSYLGNAELHPDYFNARVAFEKLVKTYPGSRRRQTSAQFIRLIDELQAMQKNSSAGDRGAQQEQLISENVRLKKDLERLKQLEIESEKRDRKLR